MGPGREGTAHGAYSKASSGACPEGASGGADPKGTSFGAYSPYE